MYANRNVKELKKSEEYFAKGAWTDNEKFFMYIRSRQSARELVETHNEKMLKRHSGMMGPWQRSSIFLSVFTDEDVGEILTLDFFCSKMVRGTSSIWGRDKKVLDKLEVSNSPGMDGIHLNSEGTQMWYYRTQAKLSNLALQTATLPQN